MERITILTDLIKRASSGDSPAAEVVFTRLAAGSPAEQLATLRALYQVTDDGFWEHAIEYLAKESWAGNELSSLAPLRASIQSKIRALFLAAPRGDAAIAREKAIVRCTATRDEVVRAAALELAGMSRNSRMVDLLIEAVLRSKGRTKLQAIRALGQAGDPRAVAPLIDVMHGDDDLVAGAARDALVALGKPAVDPLLAILNDPREPEQVRWLAGRGLGRLGDPRSVEAFVPGLNDDSYGIRWVCADGLIALGPEGLRATLRAIATKPITGGMADAAAHVLDHAEPYLVKQIVKPVLESLRNLDARWEAPERAEKALDELPAAEVA